MFRNGTEIRRDRWRKYRLGSRWEALSDLFRGLVVDRVHFARSDLTHRILRDTIATPCAYRRVISEVRRVTIFERCDSRNRVVVFFHL